MPRRFTVAAAALLFCLAATPSGAFNELEVVLVKRSDGAGGFLYDIGFSGNKDGATTCELTTPKSATPMVCPKVGDEFELVWKDLTFVNVEDEIAQSWTLIFDKDLLSGVNLLFPFSTIIKGLLALPLDVSIFTSFNFLL